MRIAEISAPCRKSGSRNTMVSSDFRPKVEIWPFCACNSSGHNYKKSSFIAELAMGHIPRSTNVFLVVLKFQIFESSSQRAHWNANCRLCRQLNKMLSYRRETALQGALQFSPKVDKKLIRRWDSERELLYDDIVHVIQNTIDSCKNSATARRGGYVLERMFTKFSEITQCNGHYAVHGHSRSPILAPIESSYTTSISD